MAQGVDKNTFAKFVRYVDVKAAHIHNTSSRCRFVDFEKTRKMEES